MGERASQFDKWIRQDKFMKACGKELLSYHFTGHRGFPGFCLQIRNFRRICNECMQKNDHKPPKQTNPFPPPPPTGKMLVERESQHEWCIEDCRKRLDRYGVVKSIRDNMYGFKRSEKRRFCLNSCKFDRKCRECMQKNYGKKL